MIDDPNAFADIIEHTNGRRFALVVSESPEALKVGLRTRGSGEIEPVPLEPYGVQLVDLTWMSDS